MSEIFAKIFEAEDIGQVLVRKDSDDDYCPCIVHTFTLPDVGTADVKYSYEDTEDGWAMRDKVFDTSFTEELAIRSARKHIQQLSGEG